jgi:hypothetical protein
MKDWQKQILQEVKKKWGFIESKDVKVEQLITQVCIFTMTNTENKIMIKCPECNYNFPFSGVCQNCGYDVAQEI